MGAADRFDPSLLAPGTSGPLADADEIDRYEAAIAAFARGGIPEDRFTAIRLQQGCYGQRQPGVNMLRVKAPGGKLDAAKLDAIAEVVDAYSQAGHAHVTTRESIQIHSIPLARTPDAMRLLARAGLTMREACGNTVRNVTACAMAGACALEHTDVNQHIDRAVVHFLRNPLNQQLPRKFKISFSGCERDCAQGLLHDLAVIATRRDGAPGFKLLAGGGLGHKPREAIVVAEFVPEAELLAAMEAVIELHEKFSDRSKRAKSRIKFLVERFGAEGFVARFEDAFARSRAAHAARPLPPQAWRTPTPGSAPGPGAPRSPLAQRQPGLVAVPVQVPLGHLSSFHLRGLASLMRKQGLDDVRTTQDQSLVLRGVRAADVPIVAAKLGALGLGLPRSGDNVVACPGTSTCRLGITASQPLAARLMKSPPMRAERASPPGEATHPRGGPSGAFGIAGDLALRVSGCHNGCAQPETGDIGIYGEGRRLHDRLVPHYQMYLGGDGTGGGRLARKGPSVPVARVEAAIARVAGDFRAHAASGERFGAWAHARAADYFDRLLAELVEVRAEDLDSVLRDVDGETDFKVAQLGGGECAGIAQVYIGAAFYAAAHERRYRDAFAAQGRATDADACAVATLRLIGQGLNDLVNPAATARVRRVLTDLGELAAAVDGKVPGPLARGLERFRDALRDPSDAVDRATLYADVDVWTRTAAGYALERDPQLDLAGALPGVAVSPVAILRRADVAIAAD